MIVLAGAAGTALGAVLGWWLRSGRYRRDTERDTPVRRPWTMAAFSIGLGCTWAMLAATVTSGLWAVLAIAATWSIALWIDLDVHRLPDVLTWGSVALGAVILTGYTVQAGLWPDLTRAAIGALTLGVGYWIFALVSSLGLGDVKLSLSIGLMLGWKGWPALWQGTLAASLIGLLVAVVLLARGHRKTEHLAFGPPMIIGALIALCLPW